MKEVLLRDIYEFIPAKAYLVAALLLVLASEFAFAIPVVAFTLAGLFLLRAAVLFRRGWRVRRYQRNLTRLPLYRMRAKDLPVSDKVQFLGMGFEWTAKHTQRAYDLTLVGNLRYLELPKSYQRVRRLEIKLERSRRFRWLTAFTSAARHDPKPLYIGFLWFKIAAWRLNPWEPAPPLEGHAWIHAVGLYEPEQPLLQDLGNRVGHALVLGTTRVGKTRLAEVIICADIMRGDVVIVIDPKGDADLLLTIYTAALLAGRADKFHFFHLGYPELSAQYNPVGSFGRITEVATRIASQMPGEGQSAAFKEFVWGYVNQIAKGLVGIGKTPSYPLIKQYSQRLEPLYIELVDKLLGEKVPNYQNEVKRYLDALKQDKAGREAAGIFDDLSQIKRDRDAIARYLLFKHNADKVALSELERDTAQSLTKAFITDQQYLSKLVASLDPFLEKMTTGAVAKLIAPDFLDPQKDVFDWAGIIQSGGIVYVGLDALSDQEVARTVGSSMLADLTSQYGRIYKEGRSQGLPDIPGAHRDRPIRVHIDEANEPADKNLIPSLNKAGGAGVSVTAYTQTSSDLEARLGNKAFAAQMLGNFNTVISFRVQDDATARVFTEKQRMVTVNSLMTFSGSADSSDIGSRVDFTSSTQSRVAEKQVPMISVTDLTQLPKGQFFAIYNGNKLYKGRVPLLVRDRDDRIPEDIRQVAEKMRQSYQSDIPEWYSYRDYFQPAEVLNEGADHDAFRAFREELKVWSDDQDMDFNLGSQAATAAEEY
ncbi:type IV conjugative transfer system coupling protein TraD [Cardiobacterium hominis]|uniref:type IV conjugative transfer system coupling protein TraD n=1 Tax=Cardiobacterium hominis TaxID=2718 RepID=UPI0028ECB0E9|nr:type IV conjugative transfer system coupling protein TraD [Cardiobacterium hominis]